MASASANGGGEQIILLNKVGLSFQPANGSLSIDLSNHVLEYIDSKGNKTLLCSKAAQNSSERDPLVQVTWSVLGKEASLQLYFKGHEEVDEEEEDEDEEEDDKSRSKRKTEGKKQEPKFIRVHGLAAQEETQLVSFFKTGFELDLEEEEWDVRGANFGELELSKLKRCLVLKDFETESVPTVEVPLVNVAQVAAPGKNEVEIQYTASATLGSKAFELSMIRFHIPSDGGGGGGQDEENKNEEAEEWRSRLKAVVDMYDEQDEGTLGLVCHVGEEICDFILPNGRYDLDLYRDFFRMRGKTYDFKIPYAHVVNIHLLEHPERDAKFLMVTLNQPIRQKQQRISHLVMVVADENTELELAQTARELAERYGEDANLAPIMTGPMSETIAKVFKTVSGKKVLIMPATGFKAEASGGDSRRARCVKCNLKTSAGFLFPMKSGLVFLHRPVLSIKYDKINFIEFKRNASTLSNDTFDLVVTYTEDGDSKTSREVEFTLIPRKQFDALRIFFTEQVQGMKIKHKNELATFFSAPGGGGKPKAAAASGTAASGDMSIMDIGDESEGSDEDSDFDAGDAGKPRGSGSDDDSGSASSSTSDSDDSDLGEEVPMGTLAEELGEDVEMEEQVSGKRLRKPGPGFDEAKAPKAKRVKSEEAESKKKSSAAAPAATTAAATAAAAGKKKDKNAPKQAKSAYSYFVESKKEEFAGLSFAERSQRASELWKQVTDKAEFEALAAQDKERYKTEMLSYQPPPGSADAAGEAATGEAGEGEEKTKKKKDKNAPKAPRSAYTFFSDELRPTLKDQNLAFGDLNRKLGEMWKAQADKTKWMDMAAADKERYKTEMKTYVPPKEVAAADAKSAGAKKTTSSSSSAGKKKTPAVPAATVKGMLASALPSGSSSSEDDDDDDDGGELDK